MNKKRIILFLFGCIFIRFLLVLLAKKIPKKYLPIMGYIALIPALGFSYIYLFGLRKTGPEVFGGKIINLDAVFHGVATEMKVTDTNAVIFKDIQVPFSYKYYDIVKQNETFSSITNPFSKKFIKAIEKLI